MDDQVLKNLLTAVEETTAEQRYKDDPNFLRDNKSSKTNDSVSEVHTGLTDSSDDEDNRYFETEKYNAFGKSVKPLLDSPSSSSSSSSSHSSSWLKKPAKSEDAKQLQLTLQTQVPQDVYTDPIFGIRIRNPLISSATIKDRMQGRVAVPMVKLRHFVETIPSNSDWVIAGVIVHKTGRTSQKGNPFSIWTLSDLHGDLKTVTLFLFRSAYKELWKSTVGTVVGVLNPSVFEKKQGSKDEACLSVDNVQKVMIFGQSKDFGTCKSTKKDGTPCTAFVNVNRCEFCIYHIKQEYQKCSRRSELQSTFSGRGLNSLRNKVLGKNEVFYAGKSYTAIPAAKSRKLKEKDDSRLNFLSALHPKSNNITKAKENMMSSKKRPGMVQHVEVSASRRLKDIELLKKLGASKNDDSSSQNVSDKAAIEAGNSLATSASVSLMESRNLALNTIEKLKAKKSTPVSTGNQVKESLANDVIDETNLSDIDYGLSDNDSNVTTQKKPAVNEHEASLKTKSLPKPSISTAERKPATVVTTLTLNTPKQRNGFNVPVLSGIENDLIDLSSPITKKHINRANVNALKWVKQNGPIQKVDPNKASKGTSKKRVLDALEESDPKRKKIQENDHFSQRFKQMMAASSAHKDLLEDRDSEEADKYFNKLEMKERLEEKMSSTFKVDCKAVRCLQCKYTSFSAADRCKEEKHPLKVFDAVKRFFKCGDCGNRTCSLNVIPTQSCKKCGSGKWERAGMMKEKCIVPKSELSIRGGEQTFVNSVISNANINLLVPDKD